MRKSWRKVADIIEREGLECVDLSTCGSGHVRTYVRRPGEEEAKAFFFSASPSDRRSLLNFRSEIRRYARGL